MKDIKIDGKWYIEIEYHDYIASNFSQFGCVIFDGARHAEFDFEELKNYLRSRDKALEKMYVFPINVYNKKNKSLHTFWAFVNKGEISPFMFFDKVRLACGALNLGKFYALDFETNKIFEMSQTEICKYGKVSDLKRLMKLDEENFIVSKWMKWCMAPGYLGFYREPKVFRSGAEREFYVKYGAKLSQYSKDKFDLDAYCSLDECKDKMSFDFLEFDKATALDFDIDNPDLHIKATILKAKNLKVKSIEAKEIFCENLICESVKTFEICAESVECEKLNANVIKTNFEHGIKIKKV